MKLDFSFTRPPDKRVYWKIIFFISHPKHMLLVLKRTVSMRRFFEHPKHMFKLMGKKIIEINANNISFFTIFWVMKRYKAQIFSISYLCKNEHFYEVLRSFIVKLLMWRFPDKPYSKYSKILNTHILTKKH